MRTATLLFYAAASLLLGIVASSFARSFGDQIQPGPGDAVLTLEVGLTIAMPVLFTFLAIVAAFVAPAEERTAARSAFDDDDAIARLLDDGDHSVTGRDGPAEPRSIPRYSSKPPPLNR